MHCSSWNIPEIYEISPYSRQAYLLFNFGTPRLKLLSKKKGNSKILQVIEN